MAPSFDMSGSVAVRQGRFRAGKLMLAGVAWVVLTVPAFFMLGFGLPGRIAGMIAIWNSTSWGTAYLLLPGVRRRTVAQPPRVPPVWRPDRSLRAALRAMAGGMMATSLYVTVGTWLGRSRVPHRLEIALLTLGVVATLAGAGLARMARMEVRADGSAFIVRGWLVTHRIPWSSIGRFEVRRRLVSEGLHVVLHDGTDRPIPVLDHGVPPSHVDAAARREMAARLNAVLASGR